MMVIIRRFMEETIKDRIPDSVKEVGKIGEVVVFLIKTIETMVIEIIHLKQEIERALMEKYANAMFVNLKPII